MLGTNPSDLTRSGISARCSAAGLPETGPTPEPVESSWDFSRIVVIEFPDLDRVKQWYDSAEYRRARELRKDTARVRMLFVGGSPPEGFTLPV